MNQNGIDLQVCVEGRPVREFGLEGRTIVEGRKGTPFIIKVRNNHPTKVHVAVLVDGVGVVSGNGKDLRGYILDAYSAYEIKGWRKSLADIAEFIFETKEGSYTAGTSGSTAQCGVISLVAHAEKVRPQIVEKTKVIENHHHHHHDHWTDYYRPWPRPIIFGSSSKGSETLGSTHAYHFSSHVGDSDTLRCATATASASSAADISVLNLGTGWGESKQDAVSEVVWENGVAVAAFELYYTDTKGLKKLGIDAAKAPALAKTAGFPTGLTGFCQPPTFHYTGEPPTSGPSKRPRKRP